MTRRRPKDFGDRAQGRVVDEDTLRLMRPPRFAAGEVVGLFPWSSPECVTVLTLAGERVAIRVQR